MEKWDIFLAKELKKRNNVDYIGAVIGNVLSISPLKIGILDNNIILDSSHIHICSSLTENYARNATITASNTPADATIIYKNILKQDDKVLVICSEDNQDFFVIDKLL